MSISQEYTISTLKRAARIVRNTQSLEDAIIAACSMLQMQEEFLAAHGLQGEFDEWRTSHKFDLLEDCR